MLFLEIGLSAGGGVGIDIFPDVAGYLFMLAAARRLSGYSDFFSKMKIALIPLIALGGAVFTCQVLGTLGINGDLLSLTSWLAYVMEPFKMVALVLMLCGIREIASDADLLKIAKRATALTVATVFYCIMMMLVKTESELSVIGASEGLVGWLSLATAVYFYLLFAFTLFEIFSCYRFICREGDEDMEGGEMWNPLEGLYSKFGKSKDADDK